MVPQEEPRSASEDTEELEPGSAQSVAANGDAALSDSRGSAAPDGAHPETDNSHPDSDNGSPMNSNGDNDSGVDGADDMADGADAGTDEPTEDTAAAGSEASDENNEASTEVEEDESMAVDGEVAELEDDGAEIATDGDPVIEVDAVELVDESPPENTATGDSTTDEAPDDDNAVVEAGGDSAAEDTAGDLEPLDAAVLDLTANVDEAEAAFLAGQPPEADTDAVALDLSDRVDLEPELDLSQGDEEPHTDLASDLDGLPGLDEGWTPDPVLAPPPLAGIDPPAVGLPADTAAPPRSQPRFGRRMRARKVRRIIRYIDPWSVLKFSFLFYSAVFVILMIAGVLLWSAAVSSGTVDNMEDFIKDLLALKSFAFEPDQIFRASALGGAILVVASTAGTVLLAILFNLISDLIGGIRVTVVELETARPAASQQSPETMVSPAAESSSQESE